MPLFRYTVVDKTGNTLNGVMSAGDESEVAQRLTAMGYALRAVVGAGAGPVTPPAAAGTQTSRPQTPADYVPPSLEPMIPMRTLASYLRQMASLIRSGLAPYQATSEILSRTRNRRLRSALENMLAQVQSGGHLAPVMTEYPRIFPTKVVGLIYCGELGGFLDTALDEAATHVEQEIVARFWPRLVAGFMRLNILAGLLIWPVTRLDVVLPRLAQLAKPTDTLSDSLHNATKALSEAFTEKSGVVALTVVAFLVATYAWPHVKRIPSVRCFLDALIIKLPLWGALHMSRSLFRFGKSLGHLYSAGVAPGPAWAAASSTCPNSVVANRLRSVGAALNTGGTFSAAVEAAGVFDMDTQAILVSGERSGDIPGALHKIAEYEDTLASMQHKKGRWLSTSLATSFYLALIGLFLILIARAYAVAIFKVPEAILGGP